MNNQQNYKSQTINPSVNLLSTTYDPSKQNTQNKSQSNTYLNQPIQYNKSLNTSTKTLQTSPAQNTLPHPSQSGTPILTSGLPTHPNHPMNRQTITNTNSNINNNNNNNNTINTTGSTLNASSPNSSSPNSSSPNSSSPNASSQLFIEKITDKVYNHFKLKYPTTIDASGFNKSIINTIITQSIKKGPLNEKSINKIIEIIDMKFKMTINSWNRQGEQYNTTSFSMDEESKISIDKYLENYTNKVTILSNDDKRTVKALEANLPKEMSPINDTIKIAAPEPFSEDFPIRDREKQTDLMHPETREYIYYIVVNSNDRNIKKYPNPNEFIIDFAPSSAAKGDDMPTGYIDRSFHNIKSCELLSVVLYDTSNVNGSSDYGSVSFPYLLLQFDELQNNYFGTNSSLSKSFAILTDYTKKGNYKYYSIVGDVSENTVSKVYNPRINLTKLTTRILLPNGTPFNFGDSMNNDTSNSCITFGIRIITIQKNLSTQFINSA
jgi:hypothetical protein